MKFQVEAILEGVTPLKDGGVSLRFHTNEVDKSQKVELMEYYQTFGWLLFSANEFQESDVPQINAKSDHGKSPSKRLYDVIYVYWKQLGGKGDFEQFYKQKMESIISSFKAQLD